MKLKPIEIKNFSYGTVRIVDPSTQGAPASISPGITSDTKVAWHIYGFSIAGRRKKATEVTALSANNDSTSFRIYLPPYSLLFNGTYIPVEPIQGVRGNSDYYDITTLRGNLDCSIYKDNNGSTRAKLSVGPLPNAIYTFTVCTVGGTDKGISVQQFTSGTFSLNYGGKPFDPIIALNNQQNAGGNGDNPNESEEEPTSEIIGFSNCYWMKGGVLQKMEDQGPPGKDGFVALRVDANYAENISPAIITYSDFEELVQAQSDPEFFIMPLYKIEDGIITVDFRSTPQAQVAEVLP